MREFLFDLVCFGGGGEFADSGGGFVGVNEGGVVSGGGKCFGFWKRRHPNIRWSLRGSKARLVSDGEVVSYGQMSGMSCR